MSELPPVHVLYENPDWMPPLVEALEAEGFEYTERKVDEGIVGGEPDPGIYLNRMSPSAHTRGHQRGVALMREMLAWLEAHDRRVVNGSRAFELEMSKYRQYLTLQNYGIRTPETHLAVGPEQLVEAARSFDKPFITKHNRGGKGLGIELFEEAEELEARLEAEPFDTGPDGQVLVQEYVDAPESHITRVEMVGGEMILAMRSSTDEGFELCPSDVCQRKQAEADPDRDADQAGDKFAPSPLSKDDPLVARYRALCSGEGIEIAGIEFVEDDQDRRYTYDINGTTNYNEQLGDEIGVHGMRQVARYLRQVVAPQVGSH
jgi:glutathione synthase/RimK-type ligase-like ATP-grasp enzyme